jgi:hypothetical protein
MFEQGLPVEPGVRDATFTAARRIHQRVATGLTLAFELAALKRLADPNAAFADARGWSEHVGIVTDQAPYVLTKFVRENGLRNDFPAEPAPAVETLDHMRTHHDTERYVYVVPDGAAVEAAGWELLPLSEAAERADWELGPERDDNQNQPGPEDDSDWP